MLFNLSNKEAKMNKIKEIISVYIIAMILICLGFLMKDLVFAEEVSKTTKIEKSSKLLEDKDKQKEKPLVVKEWEAAWGEIWEKEGKKLKEKGISELEIINKFNPVVAEQVSKKLSMDKAAVEKIVSEYYIAKDKEESVSK